MCDRRGQQVGLFSFLQAIILGGGATFIFFQDSAQACLALGESEDAGEITFSFESDFFGVCSDAVAVCFGAAGVAW